ncbi:formin homology 2 domain-containing protein [Ditylenchus destructor]|uniref:Formin homology 2 domain-containing protein n=1 Tax=Ditylenchus destructor TaxID=166010 RepID=A0AAD4NFZ8_9BILA|nr:formin homology 2 domain-containing protein [Ditylenchus destructor]
MFTKERKKEKDGDSLDNFMQPNKDANFFRNLTNRELDALFRKNLDDMNIKKEKADEMQKTFDRDKKIVLCKQQQTRGNTPKKESSPLHYCKEMKEVLNSKDDLPIELLLSLRICLGTITIKWIEEFQREDGFHLLANLMARMVESAEKTQLSDTEEDDLVNCLQEALKCIRSILNTSPGMGYLLQKNSMLCAKLIDALYVFNAIGSKKYEQSVAYILGLLAAICYIGRDRSDQFEIIGSALFLRHLSLVAEKRQVERFHCIVQCFRYDNPEIMYKTLQVINTLLSSIDDSEWQLRMIHRFEFLTTGMKHYLPMIEEVATKNETVRKVYAAFKKEQTEDYEDFASRYDKLKGDFEDPSDCCHMLIEICKNTDCEDFLLAIFHKLMLITDRKYKRSTYFSMINKCLIEVAFGDMGAGPDITNKQIIFTTPLDETLQQIESDTAPIMKRLNIATASKQEAIVMQNKYYQKMLELQTESTKLRKHISNKAEPLPEPTPFDLPVPVPCLLEIPGGASPAPPTLLTKLGGCPPPPPGPPPPLGVPPSPLLIKSKLKGGPPPPPLPPGGLFVAPLDEIPEHLKKKRKVKLADVPMKKLPWNSYIIKPINVNKYSLWAGIDETEIGSDDVLDLLKSKFSSTSRNTVATPTNSAKNQAKVKKPMVIDDPKMIQSLQILQGSCKMTFKEWHKAIMQLDETMLNVNLVGQVRAILPSADILRQLKERASKEYNNMVEGEQFVATLATINSLPIRLEAIQLKLCWNDTVSELKSTISAIAESCDEIRQSKGLTHFVSFVLLAGNYLSARKTSEHAFAFELSALCKLIETKDSENSETLLHSLIMLLDNKLNGRYTNFAIADFHHITKASRSDLGETQKTKDSLKNTLKKVADYVYKYVKQSEADKFADKMGPFIGQAQKEIGVIEGMWENMQVKWSSIQRYLCFDPKKYPMERLFEDLKQFKTHYEAALKEINKTKEKQIACRKREPLKSIQIMNFPKKVSDQKMEQGRYGVIDKIEQMLEQGNYRPNGERSPRESKIRLSSKFSGLNL